MADTSPTKRLPRRVVALLAAVAVIGLVVAGSFAYRIYQRHNRPPPPPRQTDASQIAGWMTVPYVSRGFRVPPDEIFKGIGVPRQGNDRRSLNEIAAASGRSPGELVAAVQATVRQFQASHPPPSRPEPGGADRSRAPPATDKPAGGPP